MASLETGDPFEDAISVLRRFSAGGIPGVAFALWFNTVWELRPNCLAISAVDFCSKKYRRRIAFRLAGELFYFT